MTAHEFARKLLEGPDLLIVTPRVVEYSDDEEDNMRTPVANVEEGTDPDTFAPVKFIMISYLDKGRVA